MRKHHTTVKPDTSIEKVWRILSQRHIHILPVVDDGGILLGVISEEDLLFRLIPDYREYFSDFFPEAPDIEDLEEKLNKEVKLVSGDVMNKKIYTIGPDQKIFKAISKMLAYKVGQLPVIDEKRKYLGMIFEDDIFTYLLKKHKHIVKKKKRKP